LLELRGFEEAKTGSDDLTNGGSQKILGGGRQ
jgi:hypothetical protein